MGLLLLVAAALKGHELATGPVVAGGLFGSRPVLIALVEFELAFGLWLLAGLEPQWTWRAAVVLFAGFACISLYKALSGHATCGCFGRVKVSPWFTLALDTGAVLTLVRWRPKVASAGNTSHSSGDARSHVRRHAFVCSAGLLVCILVGVAMSSYRSAVLLADGTIVGSSEYVVLEPETWIGRRFPIASHIDIRRQLMTGVWLVLLYRHSCPACRAAAQKYEELAEEFARLSNAPRIAIVEHAPYATESILRDGSACVSGRLDSTRRWKVQAPVAVLLDEGNVTGVFSDPADIDLLRAIWGE